MEAGKKMRIFLSDDKPYIWDADDVLTLRKSYRIVGKSVGCSVASPYQIDTLNLPVQLHPEAGKMLQEKGIAHLIDCPSAIAETLKPTEKEFLEMRRKCYEEQVLLGKEERKQFLLDNADNIIKGKMKKQNKETDQQARELILKDLLDDIKPIPESVSLIQIFTGNPWPSKSNCEIDWRFPRTKQEKIRYEAFKYFWDKGFYLTTGRKFGGDFLAYTGDPEVTHSDFIIVCQPFDLKNTPMKLIKKGRLGTSVKKTFVFFSIDDNGKSSIFSFYWTHWT